MLSTSGVALFQAASIRTMPSQNVALRVRGNVAVVPVELLELDVE